MMNPRIVRVKDIIEERLGVQPSQAAEACYARLATALLEERACVRQAIDTIDDWQAERQAVRARLLHAIGPFPTSAPAEGRILDERAYAGFTLQRFLFLSHPGSWVPANLFLPTERTVPAPAVVLPAGHSQGGKEAYREIAVFLAMNGYAVLTLDFVGQGERQLGGSPDTPSLFSSDAHNLCGLQMAPYGLNMNWFMLYDLRRAVDYLATRPEIDMSRLAMIGASGGGTATFYGGALDERIRVMAPAASVHSLLAHIYAGDAEQTFFDHARQGLDYPDVGAFLIAPRPCLIIANTRDIWPLEGTHYVYEELRRAYRMHDAEEQIALHVRDGEHGWGPVEFTLARDWFNRWLDFHGTPVSWEEMLDRHRPTAEECRVTACGNLCAEGYQTPEETIRLHGSSLPTLPDKEAALAELLAGVMPVSTEWEEIDRYRVGDLDGRRLLFTPEPGLLLPAEVLIPAQTSGIAVLLDEISRLEAIDWQVETARSGLAAVRPDLRGFGETTPEETWPDWENWHRSLYNGKRYALFALALLCGRHLVLDRARDGLAVLQAARALGLHGPVTFWGRRSGAIAALFAALAATEIDEVILEYSPASYAELLAESLPPYQHDYLVHGLFHAGWDLPELAARLSDRISWRSTERLMK